MILIIYDFRLPTTGGGALYRLGGAFSIINCDFYGNQVRRRRGGEKERRRDGEKGSRRAKINLDCRDPSLARMLQEEQCTA